MTPPPLSWGSAKPPSLSRRPRQSMTVQCQLRQLLCFTIQGIAHVQPLLHAWAGLNMPSRWSLPPCQPQPVHFVQLSAKFDPVITNPFWQSILVPFEQLQSKDDPGPCIYLFKDSLMIYFTTSLRNPSISRTTLPMSPTPRPTRAYVTKASPPARQSST